MNELNIVLQTDKAIKELYEGFYVKLRELTNALITEFQEANERVPLEWKVQFGRQAAEIHHVSHTWCFCDFNQAIKQINESEKPVYLGSIPGGDWKAWQNNKLQPNIVLLEGTYNGITRKAELVIHGLKDVE